MTIISNSVLVFYMQLVTFPGSHHKSPACSTTIHSQPFFCKKLPTVPNYIRQTVFKIIFEGFVFELNALLSKNSVVNILQWKREKIIFMWPHNVWD